MYGTIAKMRVNEGMEEKLLAFANDATNGAIPGLVAQYVYRTDADPICYFLVVVFASREAYWANAQSPEQATRYEEYRALLAADPEWHDGEIIWSDGAAPSRAA